MRLQLLHPVVAARSCEDCKKWWYDDAWKGSQFVFSSKIVGEDRKSRGGIGMKQERQPHAPTPCEHCPKKSPENAKNLELSQKNLAAIEFYHRTVACGWRNLTEEAANDETLAANMATIHAIYEQHKRQQESGLILNVLEAAVALTGN